MTTMIKYKSKEGEKHAQVLQNRGIAWFVRNDEGEEFQVPKKLVLETYEAAPNPLSLAGQLEAAAHPAEPPVKEPKVRTKKEKEPIERDPNLITLKELCFELNIQPRIARRNLRKAVGNVGTGSRWEWKANSEELAKVRSTLLHTTESE